MTKAFEDLFMDIQADMVSIAMEYIENRADKIYMYGTIEGDSFSFNLFYEINGKIVKMHEVNSALKSFDKPFDTSRERKVEVLKIGTQDLEELKQLCTEHHRDTPTELKIIFEVATNHLATEYKYEPVYENNDDIIFMQVFNDWYNDMKKEIEG
ncbi:hypothetical protein [Enterococcus termitis]|uniref:DUF600 domain-containing protein n=1 Tax=Enterococcus termitis TaxID=332950 RepID=A0A1E5H587_9ENTE|nr:hypothetical protein [Enterococcus termitis]OEG20005.1 hypothetical protein BCR25_14550 [Enterococcus termitis]OJG97796.1 hypothetical protein RV18_GL000613 [Enterococcus termitis]